MQRRNFIWYSLLFSSGCTIANPLNDISKKSASNFPKKLRFTVTDVKGFKELQQDYEAFRTVLEDILNIKIEFFPVESFVAAAPALQFEQVDIVLAGPSEYVILNARAKAVPIVAIKRPKYHAVIAVRAESRIESISQLKGKKIAMRSKGGTAGHIYPTKLLLDAGLDPKSDVKILFLGDKGIEALKKGDVDALARSLSGYEKALRDAGLSETEFPVIASGPLLPSDVFAASNNLDTAFIEHIGNLMLKHQDKLLQAMLLAPGNEQFQGSTMTMAVDTDYDMIREVYKAIGEGDFIH
ncbi:phosphate/phosphite/phosphonate ABC transporter substrate-binding protein [Scytonema sp. UIC 10036]|uniref:phosphate/phosphite/phosphonate ABC transporter substrate-binding protein n=1 Tax=Scytonema sp. UIC 10036 TaxID=2304196 RepID=UPI0012DAD79B|nr:phosphate/phosphite/phosphonate ABC transporter substrate-binding protein [Scytonema sp. UIC 10036]MUH01474.1 phosphate/phosphite/phosphonate ABC transporter substrate-binding protein [Scytonema sp. UIC 10036]